MTPPNRIAGRGAGIGVRPPGISGERWSVRRGPPAPSWVFVLAYRVLNALVGVMTGGLVVTALGALHAWEWNRTLLVVYGVLTTFTIVVGEALLSAAYARRIRQSRLRQVREVVERLILSSALPEQVWSQQLWMHVAPMSGAQLRARRIVDVIGAAAGLVFFAPLFAMVATLVRLDSPGPAIDSVRRLGYRGRPIRLFAFRTRGHPLPEQPVTRVGHWLVRTGLDHLPRLVNVLRGDLSLVGPLPSVSDHPAAIVSLPLFLTKPGLTGPWALSPRPMSPEEYVNVIVAYVQNWSLGRDLGILLNTVAAAMRSPPLVERDRTDSP